MNSLGQVSHNEIEPCVLKQVFILYLKIINTIIYYHINGIKICLSNLFVFYDFRNRENAR